MYKNDKEAQAAREWLIQQTLEHCVLVVPDWDAAAKPWVSGRPFEVYIDPNSDLKRALNVNAIPHTFLLNANKEIVWQHTSYLDGDEEELYEEILKL